MWDDPCCSGCGYEPCFDPTGLCFDCRDSQPVDESVVDCSCGCPLYHEESKKTGKCGRCRYEIAAKEVAKWERYIELML